MDGLAHYLQSNIGRMVTPEIVSSVLAMVPKLATSESIFHTTPAPFECGQGMVTDQSDRFIRWVADQCGSEPWGHAYGMGMIVNGEIVCGVVLEDYNHASACIHVAGIGGHWCSRRFLTSVFDYTFNQLGLKRLTGLVAQGNDAALRFDLKLGFKVDHILKDAHPDGDIYLLVMRPEDCRFLPEKKHG